VGTVDLLAETREAEKRRSGGLGFGALPVTVILAFLALAACALLQGCEGRGVSLQYEHRADLAEENRGLYLRQPDPILIISPVYEPRFARKAGG